MGFKFAIAAVAAVVLLLSASPAAALATPRNDLNSTLEARDNAGTRRVFAHYMVGYTNGQSSAQWLQDMQYAQLSGIDGFALNFGTDSWEQDQIKLAYQIAQSQMSNFWLFLSFDFSFTWDAGTIAQYINNYKSYTSQYTVGGATFVSTFNGGQTFTTPWSSVRSLVGSSIYFVPDWSDIGSYGVQTQNLLGYVDGLFSWDAWPATGSNTMTTSDDSSYTALLGTSKPYMMGISPYYYCPLTDWGKNWYGSSDRLWWDRWKQVMQIMPQFVEIITWNDFSESSYITTPVASQVNLGAVENRYVDGMDHAPFRFLLGYFTSAYKAGTPNVDLTYQGGVAWYRTTPKSIANCGDGGTKWGLYNQGTQPAANGMSDVVNIAVLSKGAPSVSLTIGGVLTDLKLVDTYGPYAYFYQAPFNGHSGQVLLTVNGVSRGGPMDISYNCPSSGLLNFNAVAFNVNA